MALLPRFSHLELNIYFPYKPYALCPIVIFVCLVCHFDAIVIKEESLQGRATICVPTLLSFSWYAIYNVPKELGVFSKGEISH